MVSVTILVLKVSSRNLMFLIFSLIIVRPCAGFGKLFFGVYSYRAGVGFDWLFMIFVMGFL
jgi:hypothetical protein